MRFRILLCLLALTACTSSGSTPHRAASPSAALNTPTGPPAASPSVRSSLSASPGPEPLVVAAAGGHGALELYAVAERTHTATLVRRLVGPSGFVVMHMSLSGGANPTVCVVWSWEGGADARPEELYCYRPGATHGFLVARHRTYQVGVRQDGGAIAWTEDDPNQALVVGDLDGEHVKVRSRARFARGKPASTGVPESLSALEWLSPQVIAGTSTGDSDEGFGLCVIDLNHPNRADGWGFGHCLHPRGADESHGYAHFEHAVPAGNGQALTIERGMGCCGDQGTPPAARVVQLRLSDGAVLGAIVTARPGRDVVAVSGGRRAIIYRTTSRSEPQSTTSIRWAGEVVGSPLSGLSKDLTYTVAQP